MRSAHILLVEDNALDQLLVSEALSHHQLKIASTLTSAGQVLHSEAIDLVILDVQLPDGDGFDFLQELHQSRGEALPVILLTSHNEVSERVRGLNLGAADYICKPVNPAELQARVQARLRSTATKTFTIGDLHFDLGERKLTVLNHSQSAAPIALSTLEFDVLHYFARHHDQVLSRGQLLAALWPDRQGVSDRSVDSIISGLRKKIGTSSHQLKSIYGFGYTLCPRGAGEDHD